MCGFCRRAVARLRRLMLWRREERRDGKKA
jgi:hypothetical protein